MKNKAFWYRNTLDGNEWQKRRFIKIQNANPHQTQAKNGKTESGDGNVNHTKKPNLN